ncbi:MAG TPA: phosphotransferase family protein [Acidimicrobiales bacterium]|nr:phosphotransferase family protein [Acidimicrobiales bacterium]
MATGGRRDDAALAEGLGRWVAAHPDLVPGSGGGDGRVGRVEIAGLEHAEGGMANETVLVDFGPGRPGMAVRLAPLAPTFPGYELGPQAEVQNAVAASGVPAPAPSVVESDPSWVGSPFLAMPRVRGDIAGPAPVFDPYVKDSGPAFQRVMHDALIDTMAAIHGVGWEPLGLGEILPGRGLRDAVARWSAYVEWSSEGDPLPALAEALDWCRRHVPPEREPVLLWGDVRLGNLVFDAERRVVAVLDWDLASLGPREMDLGWHFGLEFMMRELFGQRVPGFPSELEALERYERHTGYEVQHLAWHEVFALTRALAINDRHQRISGDPRRRDNPMGDILLARLEAAAQGS